MRGVIVFAFIAAAAGFKVALIRLISKWRRGGEAWERRTKFFNVSSVLSQTTLIAQAFHSYV